ncbi:MAG: alpha/beta hydrolase [Dehalococcoidia bacterium]|nr:alpha/beta hydrolase [Dehalococcoidia bacterium]
MKFIFIHGSGNTGLVWHYQSRQFADSEAISFPGHPEGKPCSSIADYAEWLHQYFRDKGYSELVLAGHSMGGAVAQMYALNYPQYVKGLILIGTGARLRVRPDFLSLMETGIEAPATWLKNSVEPFYSRVAPAVREKVINKVAEVGARVQLNDFRCCDEFDIMDRVHQITAPTLVICGTEDEMTPVKYSQYLADKIAGARLIIIEGGSHFVFMEKPEEVNQAIREFLCGV